VVVWIRMFISRRIMAPGSWPVPGHVRPPRGCGDVVSGGRRRNSAAITTRRAVIDDRIFGKFYGSPSRPAGPSRSEFLVNQEGRFVVALPADGVYRSEALPEIRLDLAALWRRVEKKLAPAAG